jgi:hypothetical protein
MRVGRISLAALRLVLGWHLLFHVMTLAGTTEDEEAGCERETGSAQKKSHNASESKRRCLGGARRKAVGKRETSNA